MRFICFCPHDENNRQPTFLNSGLCFRIEKKFLAFSVMGFPAEQNALALDTPRISRELNWDAHATDGELHLLWLLVDTD